MGYCTVEVHVVQATGDIHHNLQPLCPGQWRASPARSICTFRETSQKSW
jgi:hypothetical protein